MVFYLFNIKTFEKRINMMIDIYFEELKEYLSSLNTELRQIFDDETLKYLLMWIQTSLDMGIYVRLWKSH
jgi:hypothetical protein